MAGVRGRILSLSSPLPALLLCLALLFFFYTPNLLLKTSNEHETGTVRDLPASDAPIFTKRPTIHVATTVFGAAYVDYAAIAAKAMIFNRHKPYDLEFHFFVDQAAKDAFSAGPLGPFLTGETRFLQNCTRVNLHDGEQAVALARAFYVETGYNTSHYAGIWSQALSFLHDLMPDRVDRFIVIGSDMIFVSDVWRLWKLFDELFDRGVTIPDQLSLTENEARAKGLLRQGDLAYWPRKEGPDSPFLEFAVGSPILSKEMLTGPDARRPIVGFASWYPREPRDHPRANLYRRQVERWPVVPGWKQRGEYPDLTTSGGHLIDATLARRYNLTGLYVKVALYMKEKFGIRNLPNADQSLNSYLTLLAPQKVVLLPCWVNGHFYHAMKNFSYWCPGEKVSNLHVVPSGLLKNNASIWSKFFEWYEVMPWAWLDHCLTHRDTT